MRRLHLYIFLYLFSASAIAGNYGPYGGISGGIGSASYDTEYNVDDPIYLNSIPLIHSHNFNREFTSQFRIGYANGFKYESYAPNWWYRFHWAIEAFFEPQSHTVTTSSDSTGASIEYHLKSNYGFVLKPGVQTTLNTTLQLHLGLEHADFSKISMNPGFPAIDNNQGKSDTGVRVGLGFEGRLTRRMSLELAFIRTFFSNKTIQRDLTPTLLVLDPEVGIPVTYTLERVSFKPRTDQLLLNFNYYLVH